MPIIEFTAILLIAKGYVFRAWYYIVVRASFTLRGPKNEFYANSGCNILLIDRLYLTKILPNLTIYFTENTIKVRGLNNKLYNSN